jgi:hypothetical protein
MAQQKGNGNSTVKPQWVKMMDDPQVNYFTAKKEFENFWKNKERPTEEKETFGNFQTKKETKVKAAKTADAQKYSFEYKKFLNWQREIAPYVQPDGHILSVEERIKIWEQEKKNREDAEAKAKGAEQ